MKTLILSGAEFILKRCSDAEKVYLGPWCVINNHTLNVNDLDHLNFFPELDNHEIARNRNHQEYYPVIRRLLVPLAESLNQTHQTNFKPAFWEAVMSRWLYEFVSVYHERYRRIRAVVASNQEFQVHILDQDFRLQVSDYTDFVLLSWNHAYNLQIFSEILRDLKSNLKLTHVGTFDFANYKDLRANTLKYHFTKAKSHPLKRLLSSFTKLIKQWDPYPQIFLGETYGLDWKEKLWIKLRLAMKKGRLSFQSHPQILMGDTILRPSAIQNFHPESEFETILAKNLLHHMPATFFQKFFLENHHKVQTVIGLDINDITYSRLVGTVLEKGGEYISAQHGGGYFTMKDFFAPYNELDFCQRYITWGWKDKLESHPKISFIPLPSPYLTKIRSLSKRSNVRNQFLFVTNFFPLYGTGTYPCSHAEDQIRFIHNLRDFFSIARKKIQTRIDLKPSYHDVYFDDHAVYKDFIGAQHVIPPQIRLLDLINDYKLFVVDNLFTSFLELMALNRPTILVLDLRIHPVSDQAKKALDCLSEVGIFYESMTDAQDFLIEHQDNIEAWWNTSARQNARSKFCRDWANYSPDWRITWLQFLNSI
jgi:putative transferase (TIGR04331 family)